MKIRNISTLVSTALLCVTCGGGNPAGPTSTPPPTSSSNHVPSGATINASRTQGLASVTPFTFTGAATDVDGDALSYDWNFGDGTTATGATPQKTYDRAGTYSVTLQVRDARGGSTSATARVTVKSLSGFWYISIAEYGIEITQNGRKFSGRTVFGVRDVTGPLEGEIAGDLTLGWGTAYCCNISDAFEGFLEPNLDVIYGELDFTDGRTRLRYTLNLIRQR